MAEGSSKGLTMPLPVRTIYIACKIRILGMRLSTTSILSLKSLRSLVSAAERIREVSAHVASKIEILRRHLMAVTSCLHQLMIHRMSLVWVQLSYFMLLSFLGFLALVSLSPNHRMRYSTDIDLFFMSASAATVSSMSTVEMEAFSSSQLVVIALLMLFGGEVFTSLLELQILKRKPDQTRKKLNIKELMLDVDNYTDEIIADAENQIELRIVELPALGFSRSSPPSVITEEVKKNSLQVLGSIVLGFLIMSLFIGSISILAYLSFIPSAREVISKKGFHRLTFSVFLAISSFVNGGFIPINESMIPFKKDPGILSMVIALILIGNTLFPFCLRSTIKILKRFTKKEEFDYLLKSTENIGFHHLLPDRHSTMLVLTAIGLLAVQTTFFCFLEWNSSSLRGLNAFQKLMGALFQSVNARHAGETVFDLSLLSPAILVSYIIMMYLPAYTTFLPMEEERSTTSICAEEKSSLGLAKSLLMSQISYLAISVILICITERKKLTEDPLNFNVLNIVLEVISAYANVGFSAGYSCERQLKPEEHCQVRWYGFAGRWSSEGKLILIIVMFFGRLKKFSRNGGKAWKLD